MKIFLITEFLMMKKSGGGPDKSGEDQAFMGGWDGDGQ